MRFYFTFLLGVVSLRATAESDEDFSCTTSAICIKGEAEEPTWLKISPKPICKAQSEVSKHIEIARIGERFNNTARNFFLKLKRFLNEKCPVCGFNQSIPYSNYPFTDVEYCYAPVVCTNESGSFTDYVQLRPFNECELSTGTDSVIDDLENLFNETTNYIAAELESFISGNCKLCSSSKLDEIKEKLTKAVWKQSLDAKACYTPVVCYSEKRAMESWKRYPDPDCSSPPMLLSERPGQLLFSVLRETLEDIQKIMREPCLERSNEETTTVAMHSQNSVQNNKTTPMNSVPDASCFMGMKSGNISDCALSASSVWDVGHEPTRARLDTQRQGGNTGSWASRTNNEKQWIQVDFGEMKSVTGVITQGRADYDQWVKSFKVMCANNCRSFEEVKSFNGGPVFQGNTDRNTYVFNKFSSVQTCRYIRINPQTWNHHVSMRFELVDGKCYDEWRQ